jgi:hypothetical protein
MENQHRQEEYSLQLKKKSEACFSLNILGDKFPANRTI